MCDKDAGGVFFRDGLHLGDYLHPNKEGGLRMANGYDLEQLTGEELC
ncbi:MAG: hypothetical protein J6D29_06780 [Solobacterium sp.]|nr:hypothetical protein [Solobacterium sp.]